MHSSEYVGWNLLKFDIYYSGYIQTHCQKNKKIKRADQILPEVYGITLNIYPKPGISYYIPCLIAE